MTDRRRMPTRRAIREHWREWTTERFDGYTDDNTCFACGIESRFTLDRAHIVAKANGGPDTVENLHLLCGDCHRVSENIEGDNYWSWIAEWGPLDRGYAAMANSGFPIWSRIMQHLEWPEALVVRLAADGLWPDYIPRIEPKAQNV